MTSVSAGLVDVIDHKAIERNVANLTDWGRARG